MTGTLAPVPTGPRILRGEFCRCETAGGDGKRFSTALNRPLITGHTRAEVQLTVLS